MRGEKEAEPEVLFQDSCTRVSDKKPRRARCAILYCFVSSPVSMRSSQQDTCTMYRLRCKSRRSVYDQLWMETNIETTYFAYIIRQTRVDTFQAQGLV